eukprot:SAG31_NODE_42177_length_272_cov_2.121387_1_plen_36_part_01
MHIFKKYDDDAPRGGGTIYFKYIYIPAGISIFFFFF